MALAVEHTAAPKKDESFFGLLKQAVAGTKTDYTTGSLNRAIFLLGLPMMLEMALESVFSVADLFWVAHLGAEAVAAVGLTESLLTLVFAVSAGLSAAATAIVARRIGEDDSKRAALDAFQAIVVGLVVSLVMAVPLYFLAPHLLLLLGGTPAVAHVGSTYARIALGTSGVIVMLSLNNAIFRGAGDAAFAMRLLCVANVINLVLDPLLIFGVGPFPKLGVAGPAVATLIGRGLAVLYQGYRLVKGNRCLCLRGQALRVDLGEMWQFGKVASMGALQFLLEQGSWLGVVRIVSLFGANAVAAYTIGLRVVNFVVMPSMGLGNVAATLVGQNLGAKMVDRARSSVLRTGMWNLLFLGPASLIFVIFAPFFVGLFTKDPAVRAGAVQTLRMFSYGNMIFSFGIVFLQTFNGAGDTATPTYINLFGFWLLEIPLAWYLARHTALHVEGVLLAILFGQTVSVAISGFLFHRGRWAHADALA